MRRIEECNIIIEKSNKNVKIMEHYTKQNLDLMRELVICEMERDEKVSVLRKLAECEKERDSERRAREQAEYDKEYFAKEIADFVSR